MNFVKVNFGLFICISSLLILFLLNLPVNLSVLCSNENQGFAFTFGQGLLLWKELACGRGILFVSLFAIILKTFGFNTYSIIAVHIIETIILLLIGILIYLIVSKIAENNFWGGLSTAFWVIMISTPIGASDLKVEILSHYNLNEENLCVLFSLSSLFCLVLSDFFDLNQKTTTAIKQNIFSFLAGVLAVCSLMSKANGAILLIGTLLWLVLLCIFRKQDFKSLSGKILFYFFGVVLSLFFFNILLYMLGGDLINTWKDYFFLGSYTQEHLTSMKLLLSMFLKFMTRYTNSLSNFTLFLFGLLLFTAGILKGLFQRSKRNIFTNFLLIIGIWGIGNVCVIIAPGAYQPYYYHLIWPSLAIVFSLGLHDISKKVNKRLMMYLTLGISLFFVVRISIVTLPHIKLAKELMETNIFNQPQCFQDPVLPYSDLTNRRAFLQLADKINILLPKKDSTFYILNFDRQGVAFGFIPTTYIYSKRYSPTTVDSSLLGIPNIIESKVKVLKNDLVKRLPELLVVSGNIYLESWQIKYLSDFIKWFSRYLKDNYNFETTFNYLEISGTGGTKTFYVYRKKSTF